VPQLEKGITFAFVEFLLSGIAANLVDSASRASSLCRKITVRYVRA
jgi:hypothetical protein